MSPELLEKIRKEPVRVTMQNRMGSNIMDESIEAVLEREVPLLSKAVARYVSYALTNQAFKDSEISELSVGVKIPNRGSMSEFKKEWLNKIPKTAFGNPVEIELGGGNDSIADKTECDMWVDADFSFVPDFRRGQEAYEFFYSFTRPDAGNFDAELWLPYDPEIPGLTFSERGSSGLSSDGFPWAPGRFLNMYVGGSFDARNAEIAYRVFFKDDDRLMEGFKRCAASNESRSERFDKGWRAVKTAESHKYRN